MGRFAVFAVAYAIVFWAIVYSIYAPLGVETQQFVPAYVLAGIVLAAITEWALRWLSAAAAKRKSKSEQ